MGSEIDDAAVVRALRAGDENAFRAIVVRYQPLMRRVARSYVRTDAVADEVVQETWLAVVRGIHAFEGRSSLRTWIMRILVKRAQTRGAGEARSVPFSSLDSAGDPCDADARRPEERLLAREEAEHVLRAIAALPPRQRRVIVLHDVEGLRAPEVAGELGLSENNQRVLLHRARSTVRATVEATWT